MDITNDIRRYFRNSSPVVTLGNFDGVHIGHQKIFAAVVEKAGWIKGRPVAITFDPHPVKVLMPERGLRLITSADDKAGLIFNSGIKDIVCVDFNKDFAQTDAEDFINDIIIGLIGAKWVIVGHNYTFGRAKKGDAGLLRKIGKKCGFEVSVVRYAKLHGEIVSSSRVRSAVLGGRISEVAKMLGRAYHFEGAVVKGAGRGASLLDTPTANIDIENELIPKEGVYAVRVTFKGRLYEGVANIGKNPTFKDSVMSYEVHIFDYHKNLLNERLRVHFVDRLRDEKRFGCIENLVAQIKKDIESAKKVLRKNNPPLYF
jgi:riboflavin kinase/FMN adenylyltransferase